MTEQDRTLLRDFFAANYDAWLKFCNRRGVKGRQPSEVLSRVLKGEASEQRTEER